MSLTTAKKAAWTIVAFALRVLGAVFGAPSWETWLVVLKATFGDPLTAAELVTFYRLTGRTRAPTRVREVWFLVGRRAGKTIIAALVLVYLAICRTYELAPGEVGIVMAISADRKQGRVIKRYVSGLLHAVPLLASFIQKETRDAIYLTNGLIIEVHTASFKTLRGYTVVAAVCDEVAFWQSEDSANPDTEILNALRPAMVTVPGALLVCITSPYARRGEPWKAYRAHFGKDDDDVLVVQADTRTMNPTVPQEEIDRAYAEDPLHAAAEYGGEFRRDVESFVSVEVLEAATPAGRFELPPAPGYVSVAFADPSGGSSDSFTAAIAHTEGERYVLDAVREVRPPFSPDQVVAEFAALFKSYRITRVVGDRYAGEFPRELFRKHGIDYVPSERAKSDLYRELLPLMNSGRVELLDLARLRAQFLGLERRTARGGKDTIDHAPGSKDDVCNAAAGALVVAHAGAVTALTPELVAQIHRINDDARHQDPLTSGTIL